MRLKLGVLDRYLLRQNLYYLLVCLGVGAGIYLLSDLFDRLDDLLEAGLGLGEVWTYFCVKLPQIISQILPMVFLLAMVTQLGLMSRGRELLALRAGGVSLGRMVRFFLIYALLWSIFQLLFSQVLGVYGEREASRIWQEDVRKRQVDRKVISNLWFRKGAYLVSMEKAMPGRNLAWDVTIYEYAPEGEQAFSRMLTAKEATAGEDAWTLTQVREYDPAGYLSRTLPELQVPVGQGLTAFMAVDPGSNPSQLPLWQLGDLIRDLKESGSNVEMLRTSWHTKWAYAGSITVMALVALAITSLSENLYANILTSLLVTFAFYGANVVGTSIGQKGLMPPSAAAWIANLLFATLASMRVIWVSLPGRKRDSGPS